MKVAVIVCPGVFTSEHFAVIDLQQGGTKIGQLDVQYSKLRSLRGASPIALDFLLIASVVYALDKLVLRCTAPDMWTRDYHVSIPVSAKEAWTSEASELARCVSFLTGDNWVFQFDQLSAPLVHRRRFRRLQRRVPVQRSDTVCLFSGGLDSLVGAIDHLHEYPNERLLLVGHHEAYMPGPFSDQRALIGRLWAYYPKRFSSILARIGHSAVPETEITLRGRSLLFIAQGVLAASAMGGGTRVLIPENGTIALNPPLTPSRRGSCSTRTAHPYFLGQLGGLLHRIGLNHPLENPLEWKTKGEVVAQCRNQKALSDLGLLTVSCAKRNHKVHWINRSARQCGRCMPCLYRRAALHAIGLDSELYGFDVCAGDVDVDGDDEGANDVRACLSFLRRAPTVDDISELLLSNGRLQIAEVAKRAAVVARTGNELRKWLSDRAIADVKRRAGIRVRR